MAATKWVYYIEIVDDYVYTNVIAMLERMGNAGWELAAILDNKHFFFKRPKKDS